MLVLSRRVGEDIVLPTTQLTISVLGISSNRVRLGFSGPPEVTVQRREVFQRAATVGDRRESSESASGGPVPSARVLIADADECLLESYRTCLERHGFMVIGAANGLECVERLRDATPDVLVLDPALPWGGGDGVLAMMREEPDVPRVPVIVVAVGKDRGVLYRLAPYGIDDFHVKPLTGNRLAERVRAVLKRRATAVPPDGRPR